MAAEDEVVADYRSSLDDLKMNSKPLINMLTMLAEENKQFAAQFVEVIEERVLKASPSEKLPAMYLIDSIIKNLSDSNYLQLFSKNIVTTFAAVFEKVDEKTRSALFKLRHTWNDLFAMKVLYALDLGIRDIDPAWPVLPGAKIHVNPKFLPQAQPEEKKTEMEAEADTGSEHLEQQRIQEVNRESCSQLENDILLKQQLMAKQQEILKLHQQRLEIELAKARAQIELQAKLLQKEKDAAKERDREAAKEREADAAKKTQAKESTSPKKPISTARAVTKLSTATVDKSSVRSSNRDPRIRATVDLRTSKNTPASQNKHTAVQLSKSDGGTSLSDFDAVSSGNASTKTVMNASGNIFDRMQDLSSSKEQRSPAKNGAANSEVSQPPKLVTSDDCNMPVKGERKKTEKQLSPEKQGSTEVKSLSLKSSPQQKKTSKDGSKKCEGHASDGVQKSSRSTRSVPDAGLGNDSNAPQQRRPLKSAHPRSGGTADDPPVKVIKRSDHSPRVSNLKSGPQRLRKNSFREDRVTSKAQPLLSERHFESRKRSRRHESGSAKGFKKPKPATRLEIKHPHQLSDDLKELFGSEDRDYRCLPGASGSCHESSGFKDMTIAPLLTHHRRDSLLLSPPIPSSQSSGWAQFKASRPEDFPFQQTQLRDSLDGDIRSSLLVSPGVKATVARRAPLLPTPHKADAAEDGLRPSASSMNTGQVTMDALEKQMTELHRLQDMKRKLDEQREHLIRNSSVGSFGGSPNISPVDSQSTELHRLQSLKRNLDEQQERLQAMIDSGMKISDEFSSVFPSFGKDLFHQMPRIHNKYLDSNEESSRSPIFRENSPRRDRFCTAEEKAGLLGDRPPLSDSAFEPRGEESKALLPTPCLERNAPSKFNHKMGQDILLPCEDDRFYYPERDARWSMRVQAHGGSRVSNVYNVIIDGRHYEMTLVNRPLKIWHYGKEVVIRLDPTTRTLWCNDSAVYHLGEDEKSVQLNGKPHSVFVQGPPRKLWIDNQLFDINVDSPPEKINIGGKEHMIRIDGGKNRIIVDGFDICPFGTDEHQLVKLAFVMHTIQFQPPCKQILIDGKLCNLDLSGKYPVVVIDGKTRGIRFDGPPQLMFVDDKPWTVAVDGSRRCHLDGPSSKPVVLAFGGPGHEIIVDDQWYELKFGGVEKYIKVGRKMRKFQLMGNPPEVKILGEVAFLTTAGGISSNGRLPLLPSDGGRPPLLQRFGPGALRHHPIAPDVMHHPDSCENIPSLLNLNFDSQLDRSRSYSQFPHNQKAFNQGFSIDQSVHGVQPIGPPGRPVDGSYGPDRPYDQGQHRDGTSRGAQFGESGNPHRVVHDQPGRLPVVSHRPLQMGLLLRDHPGPQFGLDMPPSNQNFGQFPCAGDVVNAQWDADLAFSTAPADSDEISGNTNVPRQEVDVNSLLSKLLAAGLIKKTSENNSSDGRSSGGGLQPSEVSKKSEETDMEASEEGEGKKEEEDEDMQEDVSDLTDFNLENLKKKYVGVIQRVYVGVQCQTCGIRFLSTAIDRYNEHLDWHFRRNRREKEEMKVAKFRHWYYDVVDWIQFEELSNADDQLQASNLLESTETSKAAAAAAVLKSQESNVITCPMASRDDEDICDTCRESFEQFWDEEKEAWHLRDAIQVDAKTYHPICYEDAKTAISAVGVDEETTSVLETTVDGNKLNETDNETTQATELPCNPKTDDNDQNEISPPLDNLQQNETETEMNANVLIKSELLDQDDKPHNLSSNVFMSTDSSLGSDAKILIKSEEGVSRCHPANDLDAAVTAVKEEAKTSQIE